MKISILSDIHGNLPALEAVLRHARSRGAAERIICLGDLTGYGPFPEEVACWSRAPQVVNILGDYDKKVLNKKQRKENWGQIKTAHKRDMFAWTYQALSKRSRQYLRSFPESREITVEGVMIHLSHSGPSGHQDYIGPDTPQERLAELAANTDAQVLAFGHTHRAFSRLVDGVLFVNPGTVGRPDDGDPRASYAILDIEQGHLTVHHFRVPYDIMATMSALRRAGLPEEFAQVVRRGLNYDGVIADQRPSPGGSELEPSGTVSLLTDFGLKDHFVGVMKGVITRIAPQATLVDTTHQVSPQNVAEGARFLVQAVPYFPDGTVHVAVVDPGVGTGRRALAAQIGAHFFVAPDNGLLSLVLENARVAGQPIRLIALTKPDYWLPDISAIFHGRDIFAPVGAHLANGLPLTILGDEIDDPVLIKLTPPEVTPTGWQATVVFIDGFGNLCTNLPGSFLPEDRAGITITIGAETIHGLSYTFGDATPETIIALVDSTGHLAVAEVNGNAAQRLKIEPGAKVFIEVE
jgi:hypothetical protein